MRSATSFFKTLVRSDLRHYWPIGFVYTGIWIIGLPVSIWRTCMDAGNVAWRLRRIREVTYDLHLMGLIMAAIFGVILAMAMYSYLMTARSVGLHHSLPAKRSTQFFAHFASAMGMMLAGNVVTFLLTLLVEVLMGAVAMSALLWWLLSVSLMDFIFLSLGIFCAMLTGWVLAVPVIYAGINFVAAIVQLLLRGMASIFYFGYSDGGDLSPLVYWLTPSIKLGSVISANGWNSTYTYRRMDSAELKVLLIYTAVALGLLAVSYLLYRTRRSEAAADPVAFSWAQPIFRWIIALVGGMALGLGLYELLLYGSTSLPLLAVCLLLMASLCYIAAEMIIRKSFRVLRRGWKGLVTLCVVLVAVCIGLKMDAFGYQKYIPDHEQVKAVDILASADTYFEADDCTDRETIGAVTAAHAALLEQGPDQANGDTYTDVNRVGCSFNVTYTLTDGREVSRRYYVTMERNSELHAALNALANTRAVREKALLNGGALKVESIYGGHINRIGDVENAPFTEKSLTEKEAQMLYAALLRDVELGHGTRDMFDAGGQFMAEMDFATPEHDVWINSVTSDCTETIAALMELGIVEREEDLFQR